eukprot:CAMPEP_0116875264 /NCGR_PEP_ID=MMETSP0463-20121206/7127_1 /TAXON_ID=181622 /ORGANISM="Strombidinopsis sp, Strain SopsisLIS2011" /LENGTH=63 /DNA_ID=CAMNT_0004520537 /DNA_START=1719 /DNA_END=1910 /DNA_ORIENTATION=+
MANTLRWDNSACTKRVYDLKGSTEMRRVKVSPDDKPSKVLKDTNFLENSHEGLELNLSREDRK